MLWIKDCPRSVTLVYRIDEKTYYFWKNSEWYAFNIYDHLIVIIIIFI